MSSANLSKGWRSSSSFLLGLYALLLALCGCALVWIIHWKVSAYMDALARDTLLQRARLFEGIPGERLQASLEEHYQLDTRSLNHYGLFDTGGRALSGRITQWPPALPADGRVHVLSCGAHLPGHAASAPCHALAMEVAGARVLVLTRDNRNSSLSDVIRIVLGALGWSIPLMAIPGAIGWYLLRRRPLRRIQAIDRACRRIVMGDLTGRLPVSSRRDELDMLSSIVNAMLDRIEKLMTEVKDVSDSIAHDLRTPLTRLRARLYRMRQQAAEPSPQARQLDQAIGETDALLARFLALLRISELETRRRHQAFVAIEPASLLQEVHAFYVPLAEEQRQRLELQLEAALPALHGDRELLFEALGNLIGNALKFTPQAGQVAVRAVSEAGTLRIDIMDSGPGIAEPERKMVLQRFYRGSSTADSSGLGMGLSIVSAIVDLHGFRLEIGDSPLGGACLSILCIADPMQRPVPAG